ncbi:hypothetical protein [Salinibacter ruber]|uniref:Uncharacterized protein n=1 Tax=Salinibacter ruber TaxID=146919 RepID=A0AAW5P6S2_9BACT|nr:hypothetical protein [Salinibacter ruber]MCS4157697.1 hypothetical protein [Salinibacter ruber]
MPRNIEGLSSDIFQKQAGMRLSNDPSKWTDEIMKRVLRMHPYLADRLQGDIDWSVEPVDDTSGDAVGIMTARVGDQPIRIPIVVRDFELKPVDLYLRPDGKMDLLDESVGMQHPERGEVQVGRDVRPHAGQPMYGGGTAIKSDGMIQKVSSTSSFSEDCERMKAHVTEDFPALAESFDRIQKRASGQPGRTWDTMVVEHEESPLHGDRFKLAGFSQGERTVDVTASRHEMFEDPESSLAKWAREAMESGTTIRSKRDLDKKAMVIDRSDGGEINRFEPGDRVRLGDGGPVGTAYRLVRLRSPYPDGMAAGHVFLGDEGGYMQPITAPADTASSSGDPLSGSVPVRDAPVGARGFLVIPQEEGPPALSGPVYTEEWIQDESNDFLLALRSRLEGRTYLQVSEVMPKVRQLGKDDSPRGNSRYIVPEEIQFVEAEELMPDTEEKEASREGPEYFLSKTGRAVEIRNGNYSQTESPTRMVGLLESLGATPESAQTAVKQATSADSQRSVRVEGLEPHAQDGRRSEPDGSAAQEKVASVIEKWARGRQAINRLAARAPQAMRQAGPAPQHPMMPRRPQRSRQEAAQRRRKQEQARESPQEKRRQDRQQLQAPGQERGEELQDSLNAVNMLNQYNADKFTDATDELQSSKRAVAELLYRIRTGAVDIIEEDVAKEALSALDSVIDGLKELKSVQ